MRAINASLAKWWEVVIAKINFSFAAFIKIMVDGLSMHLNFLTVLK